MEAEPREPAPFIVPEDVVMQARLAQCGKILDTWMRTPPNGDPYIPHYASAMLPYHITDGPIYRTMCELLAQRPEMGASHLETLMLRAMQKQLIGLNPAYPAGLTSKEAWASRIQEVLDDPERLVEWQDDMYNRDLQSNIPHRGDNLKVFLSIANHLGRISNGSVVEVGCSQNMILKRLARQQLLGQAAVMRHFGENDSDIPLPHVLEPGSSRIHEGYTHAYQRLLHEEMPFSGVGIDYVDPATSRDWAYLSVYPGEYQDADRMADARELLYTDYDAVSFMQGDFDELDPDALPQAESYFFCTSAYQSPPDKRQRMFQKAYEAATEFVIVQDTCMLHMSDNTRTALAFTGDWQALPFAYNMYVLDKRADTREWQEVFMAPNTRVDQLRIGSAEILDCYGTPVPIWDVIHGQTD